MSFGRFWFLHQQVSHIYIRLRPSVQPTVSTWWSIVEQNLVEIDAMLSPLTNMHAWRAIGPITWKYDVSQLQKESTKLIYAVTVWPSHDHSQCAQNSVMSGLVVSEICKWTDGQTNTNIYRCSRWVWACRRQLVLASRAADCGCAVERPALPVSARRCPPQTSTCFQTQ